MYRRIEYLCWGLADFTMLLTWVILSAFSREPRVHRSLWRLMYLPAHVLWSYRIQLLGRWHSRLSSVEVRPRYHHAKVLMAP